MDDDEKSRDKEICVHNFYFYLKCLKFNGFAKWILFSQSVKAHHPQQKSLLDLVTEDTSKSDLLYLGLSKVMSPSFMDLSHQERLSINKKVDDFGKLLKKSAKLRYLMLNIQDPSKFESCMQVI